MTLVVLPTAELPSSFKDVEDRCSSLEMWADECQSIPELRKASNFLAVMDEYLLRTSREGRARVAAAMRRLEVRIGELSADRLPHDQDGRFKQIDDGLTDKQRHEFRQMAAHEDVVEDVITDSTDDAPASRRKVMTAIQRDSGRAAPRRRRPLVDDWRRPVFDLVRVTARLERLCQDDRFHQNVGRIAGSFLGELSRAQQALLHVMDQLG